MKLSRHARIELLICTAIVLGSCGSNARRTFTAGDYDRLEVADVNARNAIARVDALESRISEIESKLNM
jgi:hypothetical protein